MSKKFTLAQHAYRVFELETIAILEALLKWEDKLLGYPITIITDHKALTFFKTQSSFNPRQTRWMEYIERFNYTIMYVKGETNLVADCLSRYYENDSPGEVHNYDDYVNADARFDPEGDELPMERRAELRATRVRKLTKRKIVSKEETEERKAEATALRENQEDPTLTEGDEAIVPLPERVQAIENFDDIV